MYAEQHWKPMSEAKTLPTNKRSMKALFSLKIRSSIVDFGTDGIIIQFQFDRYVLRTLSAKTAIAASMSFDTSLTSADQPWSPLCWRDQNRALIDVVQQLGYPQLFLTVSHYEWHFLWPKTIKKVYEHVVGGQRMYQDSRRSRWHMPCTKCVLSTSADAVTAHVGDIFIFATRWILAVTAFDPVMDAFEFQDGGLDERVSRGRGSSHVHLLIWLDNPRDCALEHLFPPILLITHIWMR